MCRTLLLFSGQLFFFCKFCTILGQFILLYNIISIHFISFSFFHPRDFLIGRGVGRKMIIGGLRGQRGKEGSNSKTTRHEYFWAKDGKTTIRPPPSDRSIDRLIPPRFEWIMRHFNPFWPNF